MLYGQQEISYALQWQEVDAGERGFCFKQFHLAVWLSCCVVILLCGYLAVWLLQETDCGRKKASNSLQETDCSSELLIVLL